jgi:hypothetical protein
VKQNSKTIFGFWSQKKKTHNLLISMRRALHRAAAALGVATTSFVSRLVKDVNWADADVPTIVHLVGTIAAALRARQGSIPEWEFFRKDRFLGCFHVLDNTSGAFLASGFSPASHADLYGTLITKGGRILGECDEDVLRGVVNDLCGEVVSIGSVKDLNHVMAVLCWCLNAAHCNLRAQTHTEVFVVATAARAPPLSMREAILQYAGWLSFVRHVCLWSPSLYVDLLWDTCRVGMFLCIPNYYYYGSSHEDRDVDLVRYQWRVQSAALCMLAHICLDSLTFTLRYRKFVNLVLWAAVGNDVLLQRLRRVFEAKPEILRSDMAFNILPHVCMEKAAELALSKDSPFDVQHSLGSVCELAVDFGLFTFDRWLPLINRLSGRLQSKCMRALVAYWTQTRSVSIPPEAGRNVMMAYTAWNEDDIAVIVKGRDADVRLVLSDVEHGYNSADIWNHILGTVIFGPRGTCSEPQWTFDAAHARGTHALLLPALHRQPCRFAMTGVALAVLEKTAQSLLASDPVTAKNLAMTQAALVDGLFAFVRLDATDVAGTVMLRLMALDEWPTELTEEKKLGWARVLDRMYVQPHAAGGSFEGWEWLLKEFVGVARDTARYKGQLSSFAGVYMLSHARRFIERYPDTGFVWHCHEYRRQCILLDLAEALGWCACHDVDKYFAPWSAPRKRWVVVAQQ